MKFYQHLYFVRDDVLYETPDGRIVVGSINDLDDSSPALYKIYEDDNIYLVPEKLIICKATPMVRLLYG